MAANDILAALQEPLYTGGQTYSGIAAQGVAGALPSLIDPYGSTGSNAANVFGGTILAALLGRMAKSDAADENASIVAKQSSFMGATPEERLTMTQQDPATFAKLQAALNTNQILQQAQDAATRRQLEIGQGFEVTKEGRALENQVKLQTDPRLTGIKTQAELDKKFDDERNLTNDFIKSPVVVDYKYKENTLKALTEAYKDKQGTSDFEMLRRVTQMVEPGLAVRQDDQDSLQNAASALGVSSAFVDSIVNGASKNDPTVRAGMMRIAQRAFDSSLGNYNDLRANFIDRANNAKLKPDLVVPYGPADKTFSQMYPDVDIGSGPARLTARDFAEKAKRDGVPVDQARAAWAQYQAENP